MSVDFESSLNLDHDEVDVTSFLAGCAGGIERDDRIVVGAGDAAVYWATMRPRAYPAERYHVRIEWFSYPYAAPSIKFATAVHGSLTEPQAWPVVAGYRAQNFDICRPLCREGFTTHPEWAEGSTAWPTVGNPFLWVVQTIQYHLDNEYQGRFR